MPDASHSLTWMEAVAAYTLGSWAVQATLILVSALLVARLPRLRAAHRHLVLVSGLLLAALCPLGLALPLPVRASLAVPEEVRASATRIPFHSDAGPTGHLRTAGEVSPAARRTIEVFGWIAVHPALTALMVWAGVVVGRVLLLLWSAIHVSSWLQSARPISRDRLYEACGYRVADLSVLESTAITVPSVIGLRQPFILLPEGLSTGVDPTTLGHVLSHEEGHARRRDPLFRLLAALAECTLFWHPLAVVVRRQMEAAAEDACDAHALDCGAGRADYARTLLSVLERALVGRSRPLACRLGKRGSELKRRVTRILEGAPTACPAMGAVSVGAMVTVFAAAGLLEVGVRPFFTQATNRRLKSERTARVTTAKRNASDFYARLAVRNRVSSSGARANVYPDRAPITALPLHSHASAAAPPLTAGLIEPYYELLSRESPPRRDHLTVFLLDISAGSIASQEEARRQILMHIENLPPGDRFNVVAFNSRVLPYASSPVSPDPETGESVRAWMEVLPQEPGADFAAGLRHALAEEGVTTVILFADGRISCGTLAHSELLALVSQQNPSGARILAVAPTVQSDGNVYSTPDLQVRERMKDSLRTDQRRFPLESP